MPSFHTFIDDQPSKRPPKPTCNRRHAKYGAAEALKRQEWAVVNAFCMPQLHCTGGAAAGA
jgi:hypothetical protein